MTFKTPFFMATSCTMVTSTIMMLSSSNWIMLWLALELNLLAFIPIILSTSSYQETEAAVKYFLIQALGSSLLIISSMSMYTMSNLSNIMHLILLISLMMKIGMAPCHLWYPSVMTSVSWLPALILTTWQKLGPLAIMAFMMTKISSSVMMSLASINALMGGIMGLNQTHLRTILAYSSITHLGWMMALMSMNYSYIPMIYFSVYVVVTLPIFLLMNKINSMTIKQMNNNNKPSLLTLSIPVLLLSLGGLPPLLGFFPKLMVIYTLSAQHVLLLMLIIGSLMNLYYYLNITFALMLKPQTSFSSFVSKQKHMTMLILTTMMLPMILIMI